MKRILLLLIPLLLISCAGSPMHISIMSEEKLKTVPTLQLCNAYGANHQVKVRAELESRNVLNPQEWNLIDAKRIRIGMSRCALYCSWGPCLTENRSVSSSGVFIQHVYGLYSQYSRPTYVYTVNDKITSWQD